MGEGSSETAAYLIGSLSKPVTSFAILNLADQEEINIDDAIEDFVSDFEYSGMDETSITIHHLLNHLSGISPSDSFSVTDTVREPENAIAEAIQELSGVTLVSEPGENYAYNSVNYLLLGGLIESMSSMSFADYLDSEVFEPLEMTNSSADWEGIEDDLVTAHVSWFGNPVSTDAFYDHAGAPYGYIASTTEDLSKFLSTVLFDDSSDEIFEGEGGDNYVYGWFYNDEGDYYHGGATPEYRSQMMFNEDDGFGLVLLTNKYNFTEDGQVTEIVDGIGSILKGEPYDFSPGSNSYMQWGLLVAFVIIAVLMLIHVIRLIKKPAIVKRCQFFLSVVCLVIAAVLIPAVSAAFSTPWKTIWLFAPDIAWLILAFVALYVLFGIVLGVVTFGKRSIDKN